MSVKVQMSVPSTDGGNHWEDAYPITSVDAVEGLDERLEILEDEVDNLAFTPYTQSGSRCPCVFLGLTGVIDGGSAAPNGGAITMPRGARYSFLILGLQDVSEIKTFSFKLLLKGTYNEENGGNTSYFYEAITSDKYTVTYTSAGAGTIAEVAPNTTATELEMVAASTYYTDRHIVGAMASVLLN